MSTMSTMSTTSTTAELRKTQSNPLFGTTSLPVSESLIDLDVTEPDTSKELTKSSKRKKKKKKSKSAATTSEEAPSHVSVPAIEDSGQNKPIVLNGSEGKPVPDRTESTHTEKEILPADTLHEGPVEDTVSGT
jgi:hypothetical protein